MATDDQGNEIGKLFVGGLHQSTTNESLKNYFSKFGEVIEASVMMDHRTGRSRGFGYVRYVDNDGVQKVMSTKHQLEGKEIDPKPCNVNMKGRSRRQLKIFVGGIAPEHNEDTLREFFKQFGNITELTLMKDQSGHRHRGFAFVAFDDEAVVKQLINDHILTIGNKQVEIKPMEPQANRNNEMVNNKRGMGMGSIQGSQWPQWANHNTPVWSATTGWGAWDTAPGGAGNAPNLWDQGATGWTGGWGGGMGQNTNSMSQHMGRGPEMMTNPWDPQMWNPNHMATSAMQASQGNTNGWGPMTNGGWDQGHPSNQWSAALGGFSMQTNSGNDWRSSISNGMNPNAASMHGQSFAAFKR